jgi:transcription initiation factor TFIID TATA-box-binding protein
MVKIVNVVGSGSFDREFDLFAIAGDLGPVAEYNEKKYPGMYVRISEDSPLATIYRTGKFIVTGADSIDELYDVKEELVDILTGPGIILEDDLEWFSVQNLVCTTVLGGDLNLNALAIGLGLEQTEYEPEQFPGLIYRNPDFECVALIFSTGKAVITGSSDLEEAEAVASFLEEELSRLQLK